VRAGRSIAVVALCLLFVSWLVAARAEGPLGVASAHAQGGPPDCDGDGDPDVDQDEFSECYQPPPPPPHPFDDSQKQNFQSQIFTAWNVCASQGTPVPFPPELPGVPSPLHNVPGGDQALQTQYTILASQFLAMCQTMGGLGALAAQMLSVDPPDPHVTVVPLPQSMPAPPRLDRRCRHLKSRFRPACRGLAAAALRYANDTGQVASLSEVMAIASNRFAYARQLGLAKQALADLTAVKAYSGELAQALRTQSAAGAKLARLVKRNQLDVHFSARELARLRRGLGTLKGLPRWVIARLRGDSFDPAQIGAMLSKQLAKAKVKPFDLIALLRRSTPTGGLTASYQSMSLLDLAQLVDALTTQGALTQQLNIVFNDDLQRASLACHPAGRTAAAVQFINDAATKVSGPYSALLQFAAQPLRTYRTPAHNTPPVSAFDFFPSSPTLSGDNGQVSFFSTASDPDGGHIACYSWNFGDPGSGAANSSSDPNPTHIYAAQGTYTVTLTVTDDDGFANGTNAQPVTVGP
jgi:hypothetical protein